MASQEAICRIRVTNSLSHKEEIQNDLHKASISQCVQDDTNILALDNPSIPPETRLQLVESISELVLNQEKPTGGNRVREFDLILRLDGSVVNCPADASSSSGDTKIYAARYQIPGKIIERLRSDKEKVQRAELFALGCFLYQVLSGKEMMSDLGNGEMREKIQSRYVKGEFPEDVWELRGVVRVLGCWCPGFAKDLLAARSKDGTFRAFFPVKFFLLSFRNYPCIRFALSFGFPHGSQEYSVPVSLSSQHLFVPSLSPFTTNFTQNPDKQRSPATSANTPSSSASK